MNEAGMPTKPKGFKAFLNNILTSGIQETLEAEDRIKLLFINSIMIVGIVALTFFGVRDISEGQYLVASITLLIPTVVFVLFILIRKTKKFRIGAWFLPIMMFAFYTFLTVNGGARSSGVLWMVTYPLISIFLLGSFKGGIFAAVFLAAQMFVLFYPGLTQAEALDVEFKARLAGAYTIITAFSLAFEIIRLRAQQEIERGRKELARTTSELLVAKGQTDGILKNVSEGIFLLDNGLLFEAEYSDSLERILEQSELTDKSFLETLRTHLDERALNSVKDYLEMFFAPSPPWELLQEINPLSQVSWTASSGKMKHLEFLFAPVRLEGGIHVLGTVRDVTDSFELGQKLKEEEDRSARQMRHLFQIIHVKPELLVQFLHDADDEIADINQQLKDPSKVQSDLLENLYQGVHSIKGNAALVGLTTFSQKVHALEDRIALFRHQEPQWNDFLEMTIELAKIQAELHEIQELMDRMSNFQKNLEATSQNENDLILMTMNRAIERLSQETGKPAVFDATEFHSDHVPPVLRKVLKDVLVQMVRNSFIHGIERPEERQAKGKATFGKISLTTRMENGKLALTYQDDGQGLQVERIKEAAKKSPHFKAVNIDQMSDAKVASLIFHPGFSTAEEGNLHAGRGVGMNLVKSRIESRKGVLKVRSAHGKGLAFDIELPLT